MMRYSFRVGLSALALTACLAFPARTAERVVQSEEFTNTA
jgi:hypothetical protein